MPLCCKLSASKAKVTLLMGVGLTPLGGHCVRRFGKKYGGLAKMLPTLHTINCMYARLKKCIRMHKSGLFLPYFFYTLLVSIVAHLYQINAGLPWFGVYGKVVVLCGCGVLAEFKLQMQHLIKRNFYLLGVQTNYGYNCLVYPPTTTISFLYHHLITRFLIKV